MPLSLTAAFLRLRLQLRLQRHLRRRQRLRHSYGNVYANSYGNVYANRYGNVYSDCYGYVYANRYGNVYANSNGNGYGYANTDADSDTDPSGHVSQITPTGTTCNEFKNGTAETLLSVNYTVRSGKIKPSHPRCLLLLGDGDGASREQRLHDHSNDHDGQLHHQVPIRRTAEAMCLTPTVTVHPTITQNAMTGAVTVQFNAPVAGTYFISAQVQLK